jgi:putative ABC transport system permease protein
MIGIIVGMALFIAMIGLGNGLRIAVTNQFSIAGPDIIGVQASGGGQGPPGQGVVDPLIKEYADDITDLSNVELAICVLFHSVAMEFNNVQNFEFAQSVPISGELKDDYVDRLNLEIVQGRFFRDNERGKVVLGNNFYQDDTKFGKELKLGQSVLIDGKNYEVIGFLEKRGSFIIDDTFRMNEDDVRDISGKDEDCNLISVRAKTRDDVDAAKLQIEKYLRDARDVKEGEEDFSVSTPEQALSNLNSILNGIQIFILLIAFISMIVGAIGIINTMFTAVMERKKEIGIMKAIGAQNQDIFALFFIESGLLGLVGGLIGIGLGYLMALGGTSVLSSFFNTPTNPDISFVLVIFALLGAFVIGSLSGIIPALQAAGLQPVKALKS